LLSSRASSWSWAGSSTRGSLASSLCYLTLPGSLATIIVVERARDRCRISFAEFSKVGVPTAVLSVAFGALWLGFR
jgi:Na+/H+ antiporter NhaD/arsenite permease-like protein